MTKLYIERPEDIATDAKIHIESEYGKYRMEIIDDLMASALSQASNTSEPYPGRYLARYAAFKEVKDSILSDLGNHIPTLQK